MTETPGSAPAGWYDDPHMPGRMRYFDGVEWTNHFHNPDQAPDVGSWINNTFSVFARYWQGAAILAFGATFLGNLVAWYTFRWAFGSIELRNEEFVNFSMSKVIVLVLVGLVGFAWQGLGWLALNRYMQRAHHQAEPSVGESIQRAIRRLPRYLGIIFVLGLAFALAIAVIVGVTVAAPIAGVFLILLCIPLAIWVGVKLTFLIAALAASPAGTGALRASADVSAGRFWSVAGRVIVFTIALGFAGNILSTVLGDVGSAVDPEAITEIFQVDGDELVIDDFQFSELFPSGGRMLVALLIMSVIRAASTMISTSAFMRLYLDMGAPSELSS